MRFYQKYLLPLITISLSACYQIKEPENNFLDVKLHSFEQGFWLKAPEVFNLKFSLSNSESSPSFKVAKTEDKYETSADVWSLNYLTLLKLPAPQKISVTSSDFDDSFLKIFQSEIAAKTINLEAMPLHAPVTLTLQDNPSANRSFEQATGAKIKILLRRRFSESASVEVTSAVTMASLIQTWWTNALKPVAYEEYLEYFLVSKKLVEETYGPNTFYNKDVVGDKSKAELSSLRSAIQKYVKQKSRREIKIKMLSSIKNNPAEYNPSKASLFWDYLKSDESTEFVGKHLVKMTSSVLQKTLQSVAQGKTGTYVESLLEKEIEQDAGELIGFYETAKEAMQVGISPSNSL